MPVTKRICSECKETFIVYLAPSCKVPDEKFLIAAYPYEAGRYYYVVIASNKEQQLTDIWTGPTAPERWVKVTDLNPYASWCWHDRLQQV